MMQLRPTYRSIAKKVQRETLVKASFALPADARRNFERWLRGREQCRTLRQSDAVVVSCGKSGRTWLRTLLSRFFQLRFDIHTTTLINFDNYHCRRGEIPRVMFTHDDYLKYYTGNFANKREYRATPTVLMARHPADVAVSQYFQWKHRIPARKKWLNEYPLHGVDISVFDFVMDRHAGIPYVIEFLNAWSMERASAPKLMTLRYESLHADNAEELHRVLDFMGFHPTAEELRECVCFGSFENMRRAEEANTFYFGGRRMRKARTSDEDGQKVRRGKAGGWRDYFDAGKIERIQAMIDRNLAPGYGYRSDERMG